MKSYRTLSVVLLICLGSAIAAESEFQEGLSLFEKADYHAADQVFLRLLSEGTSDPDVYYYSALIDLVMSNPGEAIDLLSEALEIDGSNVDATYALAKAYEFRGQEVNAIRGVSMARRSNRLLKQAIDLDPRYLPALKELALRQLSHPGILGGDVEEGLVLLETLSKRDDSAALEVRAAYERRHGDPTLFEPLMLEAIGKAADSISPRIILGKAYFDQQRYQDAIAVLAPISDSHQEDSWLLAEGLRKNRGHIFAAASYFMLGDTENFKRHETLARDSAMSEADLDAIDYWFDRYDVGDY